MPTVIKNGTLVTASDIIKADLLIDGGYTHAEHTITNGDTTTDDTDLWLPGDTLRFEVETDGASVKVVTQHGVAATADVPDDVDGEERSAEEATAALAVEEPTPATLRLVTAYAEPDRSGPGTESEGISPVTPFGSR